MSIEMDRPGRIAQIRARLKAGDDVQYFDRIANGLIAATVIELNRVRLVVENHHDKKRWSIPFGAVNIDDVSVDLGPGATQQPVDRHRLRVGDLVGFRDRDNAEQYGRVLALNQKSASILTTSGRRWRVAYALLFPVYDAAAGSAGRTGDDNILDLLLEDGTD